MKPVLLILGTLLISTCYGDNKTTEAPAPPTFTMGPPTNITTPNPAPKPTTSTEKPTTSTEKPTTSTEKPTTSTEKPTTSTEKPTTSTEKPTTPKPITTSTPKPTTTSTAKPTSPTTVKPTTVAPPVDPTTGKWDVKYNNTNESCIIAKMALEIDVSFLKDNKTSNVHINVPENAHSTGSCLNLTDEMVLSWGNNNTIVFNFEKVNKTYGLNSIFVKLNVSSMNDSLLVLNHTKVVFNNTKLSKSYKCDKVQSLNLTSAITNTSAILKVSHLRLAAFYNTTTFDFGDAVDCEPFVTPDIVPIAAGCALAALIIIVLVAYLLGRRRSQARGYLSMFTQNKREEDYIPLKTLSCFN